MTAAILGRLCANIAAAGRVFVRTPWQAVPVPTGCPLLSAGTVLNDFEACWNLLNFTARADQFRAIAAVTR